MTEPRLNGSAAPLTLTRMLHRVHCVLLNRRPVWTLEGIVDGATGAMGDWQQGFGSAAADAEAAVRPG